MSIVVKVEKLIVPLSQDSQGIFHKSTDNQEAPKGRDIPRIKSASQHRSLPAAQT